MKSARRMEIAVSREHIENVIQSEMTKFLRGAGFINTNQEVYVTLPVKETFMLPVRTMEEIEEERLVCTVL